MTSPKTPPPELAVPSPCVSICRLDASGKICLGCARTLDEIGAWSRASDAERLRILALLPARRASLPPP